MPRSHSEYSALGPPSLQSPSEAREKTPKSQQLSSHSGPSDEGDGDGDAEGGGDGDGGGGDARRR